MGRVIALDPGERWVGVAVCDADGRVALPSTTLDLREEPDEGVARLQALIEGDRFDYVVVGVPVNAAGEEDAQAAAFRAYGERVAKGLALPMVVQNERHSNPLAMFAPDGKRRRGARSVAEHQRRRRTEHALAAAEILQRWLDAQRRASPDR